jgi:hypothetical protein
MHEGNKCVTVTRPSSDMKENRKAHGKIHTGFRHCTTQDLWPRNLAPHPPHTIVDQRYDGDNN